MTEYEAFADQWRAIAPLPLFIEETYLIIYLVLK